MAEQETAATTTTEQETATSTATTTEKKHTYNEIEQSKVKRVWFILQSLVTKDFKLKYRRSVLGVAWSVLNPLLMMVVMAAVFSFMFRFQIENFALYLILGTIMFDFMSHSTNGAMSSIVDSSSLIKKIRIEKLVFPIEKVLFELVNFVISLIAVVLVMGYYQVVPSIHAIWGLPFVLICVAAFSAGLGMLISALSVFFRDVMHLWSVLITAWTYATPLFYPYEMLADWMQTIMQFNPMYHYITFFRDIMMWDTNPGGIECLICLAMASITFIVGFIVFRKSESKFILYI